jgi:hypothetical protein
VALQPFGDLILEVADLDHRRLLLAPARVLPLEGLAEFDQVLEASEEHADIDVIIGDEPVVGIPQRIGDAALLEPIAEDAQHIAGRDAGGNPMRHPVPKPRQISRNARTAVSVPLPPSLNHSMGINIANEE